MNECIVFYTFANMLFHVRTISIECRFGSRTVSKIVEIFGSLKIEILDSIVHR